MDAYSGYNQIKIYLPNENKTTFTTSRGIFFYKVMPFGLKNIVAIFQRMVDIVFKYLIGHTMDMYVDDMLMKSVRCSDHLCHLSEASDLLQKYQVKLNLEQYTFVVASGKFL